MLSAARQKYEKKLDDHPSRTCMNFWYVAWRNAGMTIFFKKKQNKFRDLTWKNPINYPASWKIIQN